MKPSGRVLRSASRLLVPYRACSGVAPPYQVRNARSFSRGFEEVGVVPVSDKFVSGGEWGRVAREDIGLRRTLPLLPSATLQRRGFLSCGDGDEDSGVARHFEEDRVIGYTPEQIFAVVAAVDLYEDFVPWCQRSQVVWRNGEEQLDAELQIGFKFFVERYISHVQLKPPNLIKTSVSQSNLFDFLDNEWRFQPGPTPESCHIHFRVDFQFRSALYRKVASMFFNEVQARLVGSFEERCQTVYGPSLVVATSLIANSDTLAHYFGAHFGSFALRRGNLMTSDFYVKVASLEAGGSLIASRYNRESSSQGRDNQIIIDGIRFKGSGQSCRTQVSRLSTLRKLLA